MRVHARFLRSSRPWRVSVCRTCCVYVCDRRPQTCHQAHYSGSGCRNCGWDARFSDVGEVEVIHNGKYVGRIHACATECTEDRFQYNDWITHVVQCKKTADSTGDETHGAKEAYTVKVWGPIVATRRGFLQHTRTSLDNYFRHQWSLHNHRIVAKAYKYVGEVVLGVAVVAVVVGCRER